MPDNNPFTWNESNDNTSREFWFSAQPPKKPETKEVPDIVIKWFSSPPPKEKK